MPISISAGDAEKAWTSFESATAPPLELRLLSPEEALSAETPFAPLIGVWLDRRTDAHAPDWDAFDFADFRGWHSHIMTSVFRGEEPDPEFRIVGELWRTMADRDVSGYRFSQCTPRLYTLQHREYFRSIRETGSIGLASGNATIAGREFFRIQVIDLPIRRGGPAVDGLIHAIHIEPDEAPA